VNAFLGLILSLWFVHAENWRKGKERDEGSDETTNQTILETWAVKTVDEGKTTHNETTA